MEKLKPLLVRGVEYEVFMDVVASRRSSVRLKNGAVYIKISRFVSMRKRGEMIDDFLIWALKYISKANPDPLNLPKYFDGEQINCHNKFYELKISFTQGDRARLKVVDSYILDLKIPKKKEGLLKEYVQKLIIKDQADYLSATIEELNEMYFKEKINKLRFKRNVSRFGSCSSRRNINISYSLLFAPREVFRYVCVHELAHLKEMNHSKRFWSLVAEACPDYKTHEKWLKSHAFFLNK